MTKRKPRAGGPEFEAIKLRLSPQQMEWLRAESERLSAPVAVLIRQALQREMEAARREEGK